MTTDNGCRSRPPCSTRAAGASAASPRAPGCARRTWRPCSACSPPTRCVDQPQLDHALRNAVGKTYNRLDVDGGTSTNDTVLLLSSGASGVTVAADEFKAALTVLAADLVKQLQADAEGVTKHVSITVQTRPPRPRRSPPRRSLPRTTSARPRSSPPTRTGAGSRWRSATRRPPSIHSLLDITLNGAAICIAGGKGVRPVRGRPVRPGDRRTDRPARRRRVGDGADHRPVARVRRRELGVLLMKTTAQTRRWRRPPYSPRRCLG